MMKYIRNKEIKHLIITMTVLTVVFSGVAVFNSLYTALFVLCICLVFTFLTIGYTIKRYRKIEEMSAKIDRILHGDNNILYSDYTEGELAVLQNEIGKLTVKLGEQADKLLKDKIYLADSIADISHQIRTPLTSLNIFVSMLTEENVSAQRRNEMLSDMQKLLHKIEWQINALLKISKLDAGTMVLEKNTVNVKQLIDRAISVIAVPMDIKNQTVAVECKNDVTFCGDAAFTSEALINILKNCSEHTPENGKITIEAQENTIFTEIKVSDNGSGIAEDDLPHIFERFYKGKNSSEQSVGIGLALAQMIINSQDGTIKAENSKLGGAVFTVKFYKSVV